MTDNKTLIIARVFISAMMSFLMTGFFGFVHLGLSSAWLHAWAGGFVIAWPVAFFLSPVVGRLSFRIAGRIIGRM